MNVTVPGTVTDIVSDDGDFDSYIAEKRKKKVSINRIGEVCQASKTAAVVSHGNQNVKKIEDDRRKKEQAFRTHFGKYLKNEYEEDKENILEAYMEAQSRQEFNNNLQQYFYNEAVSDIMRRMSNLIKDMPGRL